MKKKHYFKNKFFERKKNTQSGKKRIHIRAGEGSKTFMITKIIFHLKINVGSIIMFSSHRISFEEGSFVVSIATVHCLKFLNYF